ncbi:unnamed protein product [Symbiodinium natans]|uniref:FZ domain-containing protein n=1 Tax=Symbiodinium natans TaxID=878477 RepID=A0A812UZF1_9DINO|nr:unnamed protein product [Symbiodinium natans]
MVGDGLGRLGRFRGCSGTLAALAFLGLCSQGFGQNLQKGQEAPCSGSSILRMIRDFAPECISACPEVCVPMASLITNVMMGQDPFLTICPNWQTFYCMALPDVLGSCTPLLDAAKKYVGIDLPRSGEQLMEVCEVSSTSTAPTAPSTSTMTATKVTTITKSTKSTTFTGTTFAEGDASTSEPAETTVKEVAESSSFPNQSPARGATSTTATVTATATATATATNSITSTLTATSTGTLTTTTPTPHTVTTELTEAGTTDASTTDASTTGASTSESTTSSEDSQPLQSTALDDLVVVAAGPPMNQSQQNQTEDVEVHNTSNNSDSDDVDDFRDGRGLTPCYVIDNARGTSWSWVLCLSLAFKLSC